MTRWKLGIDWMVLTLDMAPMIKPICDPIKNPPVAMAIAWRPLKFFALAKGGDFRSVRWTVRCFSA